MSDITEYEQLVSQLAAQQSSELISNSSVDHAAVLVRYMFKCASKAIRIFNGCLNKSVYGKDDVISAARNFVEKGGRLEVVIQDGLTPDEISSHGFLQALNQTCSNNTECQGSFELYAGNDQVREIPSHFLIMDGSGYRLESNKDQPVAFASFNDQQIAKSLNTLFERILEKSEKISYA